MATLITEFSTNFNLFFRVILRHWGPRMSGWPQRSIICSFQFCTEVYRLYWVSLCWPFPNSNLLSGTSVTISIINFCFLFSWYSINFYFRFRYFFVVMAALIVIGLFNGLLLLPVLLSLLGPKPEVQPLDGLRYLTPPTPDGGKSSTGGRSGTGNQLESTTEHLNHRQTVKAPPLAESEYDYQPTYTQTPPIGGHSVTIHSRPLFRRQMSDEVSLSTISEENGGIHAPGPVLLSGGALSKSLAQTSRKDMTLALSVGMILILLECFLLICNVWLQGSPKSPSNVKTAKVDAQEDMQSSPMAISASIGSVHLFILVHVNASFMLISSSNLRFLRNRQTEENANLGE